MLRRILALAFACAAAPSFGQLADANPDWKEVEAPPPPAVRTQGLVAVDMPSGISLRFGVDPASVSVGADGVVRYVVVASSPTGAVNALYEGLRCESAEVKVYARHNPDSGWVPARDAQWQPLHSRPNSRHSLSIARNGACVGRGPSGTASEIVRSLRTPPEHRFEKR
ncbi:MAG: hypothetical protein K0S48_3346 [Ramlibacter sp.]|jgi:hypothetical protein|nr:hypothetical protein [Ramlibacter sp.]MCE3271050.1 hypothetical protein [Ramlibacter sp.]